MTTLTRACQNNSTTSSRKRLIDQFTLNLITTVHYRKTPLISLMSLRRHVLLHHPQLCVTAQRLVVSLSLPIYAEHNLIALRRIMRSTHNRTNMTIFPSHHTCHRRVNSAHLELKSQVTSYIASPSLTRLCTSRESTLCL